MENEEISLFYWDSSYNPTFFASLALIIAIFTSLRFFLGLISHVDPSYELTQKDNGAFGISFAGAIFGVTLVLTAVVPNSWTVGAGDALISVASYGVLGIVLMAVTRLIFDRVALPHIHMRDEIVRGNYAVAIVDAGNVIAAALVIRAVMVWTPENTLDGMGSLVIVYALSQLLLTVAAMIHAWVFKANHRGHTLQQLFLQGNIALALRFSGRRIGMAFAIVAASQIMTYEVYEIPTLLLSWTFISILLMLALTALDWIATRIILIGIKTRDEVVGQRNVAVGAVQGVIYIAIGLVVAALMR